MMSFDFAMIGRRRTPDQLAQSALILSKAYGINLCYFDIRDLELEPTPFIQKVTFWNGDKFDTSAALLPEICETKFYCYSQNLGEWKTKVSYVLEHSTLVEFRTLGKIELTRAMQHSEELVLYSIPSFGLNTYHDFLMYANLLKRAIVKPSCGRKGMAVRQANCIEEKIYFQKDDNCVEVTKEIWDSYLAQIREENLGIPIMQPRLNFQFEGRSVDFRLLVQRGGTGDWEKVAIYARVGESDTVSNLAQGGFVADPMTVLASIAPGREEELYQELEYLCLAVPKLIQSKLEKPVACLGIDVGIDCDTLQPYVIEANTFPGTKYHTWDLAHKKVQYFKYLIDKQRIAANFKSKLNTC